MVATSQSLSQAVAFGPDSPQAAAALQDLGVSEPPTQASPSSPYLFAQPLDVNAEAKTQGVRSPLTENNTGPSRAHYMVHAGVRVNPPGAEQRELSPTPRGPVIPASPRQPRRDRLPAEIRAVSPPLVQQSPRSHIQVQVEPFSAPGSSLAAEAVATSPIVPRQCSPQLPPARLRSPQPSTSSRATVRPVSLSATELMVASQCVGEPVAAGYPAMSACCGAQEARAAALSPQPAMLRRPNADTGSAAAMTSAPMLLWGVAGANQQSPQMAASARMSVSPVVLPMSQMSPRGQPPAVPSPGGTPRGPVPASMQSPSPRVQPAMHGAPHARLS